MKNYFTRFIEWQNYVHYILGAIMLWVFLGVSHQFWLSWSQFWFFTLAFFIFDSIVHAWFTYTPFKWMRWND